MNNLNAILNQPQAKGVDVEMSGDIITLTRDQFRELREALLLDESGIVRVIPSNRCAK